MNLHLLNLIRNTVSDYKSFNGSKNIPKITDLEFVEQKTILWYLLGTEDYKHALSHPAAFFAAIKEVSDYVNKLLADEFNEQYVTYLYEQGLRSHTDQTNGEITWY